MRDKKKPKRKSKGDARNHRMKPGNEELKSWIVEIEKTESTQPYKLKGRTETGTKGY